MFMYLYSIHSKSLPYFSNLLEQKTIKKKLEMKFYSYYIIVLVIAINFLELNKYLYFETKIIYLYCIKVTSYFKTNTLTMAM